MKTNDKKEDKNMHQIQTAQEWADEMFKKLGLKTVKPKVTKNSAVSCFAPMVNSNLSKNFKNKKDLKNKKQIRKITYEDIERISIFKTGEPPH